MSAAASRIPAELIGMSPAQLQAALGSAQTALVQLLTGNKPMTVSYAQGEGNRSVTYTRANEPALRHFIRELQTALGQAPRRRAIATRFW